MIVYLVVFTHYDDWRAPIICSTEDKAREAIKNYPLLPDGFDEWLDIDIIPYEIDKLDKEYI